MEIRLKRKVRVSCIRVIGKVAFAEKRVVEHAVVIWVAERLRAGATAMADDLVNPDTKGPLAGMPAVVGRRLAKVCEDLKLLRQKDAQIIALSPEGQRLATSEESRVFVPQLGTWQIFWSDDSLLPHPILRVEPWQEPSAHNEREQRRTAREQQQRRQFVPVPEPVRSSCDAAAERSPLTSPGLADGRPLRLVEIEQKGEPAPVDAEVSVSLLASPGAREATVRFTGRIGQARIDGPLPAPASASDHATLWQGLLRCQGQLDAWNARTGALKLPFSMLKEDARRQFRMSIPFKEPRLGPLGDFGDTRVEDVPIEPASPKDAQQWFRWLLERSAGDAPLWPEDFQRVAAEHRARFPQFTIDVPMQPDFARLVRGVERPPLAYWHIQAPLDIDGGIAR